MQRADILLSAAQIFRRKQEILLAILDQALDTLIADLQPIVDSDQPADQKLSAAMRAYIDRMTRNADLAAVLLLEHRSLEPALRAQHVERRDRFEALWRQIILQGMQHGLFRPVDEAVASYSLLVVH